VSIGNGKYITHREPRSLDEQTSACNADRS